MAQYWPRVREARWAKEEARREKGRVAVVVPRMETVARLPPNCTQNWIREETVD